MVTVIHNANVYLGNREFAQAVLLSGNTITQVGTDGEILAAAPADCRKIDAKGNTLIPGFNDSHQHLFHVGENLLKINLAGCKSLADVIETSKAFLAKHQIPAGQVVEGWGWNQDYFTDEKRLPTRQDLDQISTQHPLLLTRACGHVMSCNTLALERAGVWDAVPQVEGGQLDVDEQGRPTGIARESSAKQYINAIIPPATAESRERALAAALAYAASKGITSVQTNDVTGENYKVMLPLYEKMVGQGAPTLRAYHQCCIMDAATLKEFLAQGHCTGVGNDRVKIGPLKLFTDGSLGARTALMRKDYADEPGTRGIGTLPQAQLEELVAIADAHGMQVAVHAIGDQAMEMVLDAYQKVIGPQGNKNRHGIVHCQITDMPLLKRFRDMDIYAMVQPIFLHYDLHMVEQRVGKALAETSYAFETMHKLGLHVSFGTDSPVEDMDPIANLHCAVNRQDLKHFPAGGYYPQERMDIYQAVEDYTLGSAQNSFDEAKKGRIAPGYLADFTLLSQDIFHVPSEKILDTQVLMTMVDGQIVFEK